MRRVHELSRPGEIGDTMADCELCGAPKVSTRAHRVNNAMLAICHRCISPINLQPKQEAPGLTRARSAPQRTDPPARSKRNNLRNQSEQDLTTDFPR